MALPLAIVFPEVRVTAIERSWKKAEFISLTAMQLGLEVVVVAKQVETEARLPVLRERFDLVLARAVAYLPTLAEYCLPCTRVGGRFVAMKSESLQEEIDDGLYAIERLGGRLLNRYRTKFQEWRHAVAARRGEAAPTPEEFLASRASPPAPADRPGVKIAKPERKRRRLSNCWTSESRRLPTPQSHCIQASLT
ncbi:MAG: RsmG family class I SAM-dependent methyltransferase [Chloroflexia bacterium]